ncbi:hypothetical protein IT408_03360 [Candidatus Uhrbacteria bacterium]|nr:hypothetical protein [Candidatus Uhrbacteria bacterium]
MNDKHLKVEEQAKLLEQHLKNKEQCHDGVMFPFEQTADALNREASVNDTKLEISVSRTQRGILMQLAKKQKQAPQAVTEKQTPSETKPVMRIASPWLAWVGGAVTVLAVIFVAVFIQDSGKKPSMFPVTQKSAATIARLVIPEVSAADAFSFTSETQDSSGVDPRTTFLIKSSLPLSTQDIQNHVRIVPALGADTTSVEVSVDNISDGQFRIRPVQALQAGKVYTVAVDAAVKKADGEIQARDFTWTIQTKNIFRVLSSVPDRDASYVPVNTGIEFVMSMNGWEDPKSKFTIKPPVDGRFEQRGRSLIFVPSKPLTPGQLYIATLKKGLAIKGSDHSLEQDEVLRFETAPLDGNNANKWFLNLEEPFMTVAPNKEVLLPIWADENNPAPEITATGFVVSLEEAKNLMKKDSEIPLFADVTRRRGDVFAAAAKTQSFQLKPTIERQYYRTFLKLPSVQPGLYVVKVEPKGSDASWFFLQVTKVAAYVASDKDTTIVWAMNTETNQPLQNVQVTDNMHNASTDAKGIARIPTASEIASTTNPGTIVIQIGNGADTGLVRLKGGVFYSWDHWNVKDDRTISYMMPDRPLYHPTDSLDVFGKAIDRDSKKPVENLTVELQRNGFTDWFVTGEAKAYRTTHLETDEQGVFHGKMEWNRLQPGYYQLVLKRDGIQIRSRSIEIRDFIKPAYFIEVTPEHKAVINGEMVKANIRALFFDGTPVSNLALTIATSGAADSNRVKVTTDADGNASFSVPSKLSVCNDSLRNSYCPETGDLSITVRPEDAENAEISGTASIDVWRSRVHLETDVKNIDNVATVTLTARTIDLVKAEREQGSTDVLAEPVRGLKVTGRIVETTWEKRENGTTYDFIEKKVIPMYKYEQKFRDIAPIDITTDSSGKAIINVPMSDNASYLAHFTAKDENGLEQHQTTYLARDGYYNGYPNDSDFRLDAINNQQNQTGYKIGDQASFELLRGTSRLPDSDTQNMLFIKSSRGIKDVQVTNSAVYHVTYTEQDIPNVSVHGIVFMNGGFIERQTSTIFDTNERALKLKLEPNAISYAPGAKAEVRITATDKQGNPAKNARVNVTFVDEAVFAAAFTSGEEKPLDDLYTWVNDSIIARTESHMANVDELMRSGGAEMGGSSGGDDVVRRNFKDTAAVKSVTLNENGEGMVELDLPDSLTSWRATGVVLSEDIKAGSSQVSLPVTKQVFVEVVIPEVILQADKPVLKLRSYGSSLKQGDKVQYEIDAPSLGLKQDFDGAVGIPAYIAIDHLVQGKHTVTFRVKTSKGEDAIEKEVEVVPSRFVKTEAVQTELAPAMTLPDIGESREIDLQILPKTRAQYFDRVETLAYSESGRVESQVAANIARTLLKEQFAAKEAGDIQSVGKYQKLSGGIAILPYASDDIELSAKLAAIAPDQFDRAALSRYFYEVLKRPNIAREQQIHAISGLAALGEAVLPELHALAEQKELNWREQLALARAAIAIGDQQTASSMLALFFARMEEQDGKSFIRISEDKREQIEATAEMAVIAAKLNLPQTISLDAWLQENWADDAFTDLDRIAYLQTVVPAALGRDVKLTYTLGSGDIEVKLLNGRAESITLTADEAKNFRIVSVDGPAVAVFTRLVASPVTTSNKDIGLTRTFSTTDEKVVTNSLKEGDAVIITLQPSFTASAPSGCYLLRDHVPAGLAPMISLSYEESKEVGAWYPQDVDKNAITFTVCNPQNGIPLRPIVYRARVTARGTYQAEPAILQSYKSPSVSTVTSSTIIEIK